MKKVMFFSDCFYPSKLRGGAAVSMTNLAIALGETLDISVVSTAFEMGSHEKYASVTVGKNRIFNCDVYYLEDKSFGKVTELIKKVKPDVMYVSSLFSSELSLPALFYKKNNPSVKLMIAPRGELMTSRVNFKAYKKKPFLLFTKAFGLYNDVYFHSTEAIETKEIHQNLGIGEEYIVTIPNLCLVSAENVKIPEKQKGKLKIVTISRIHSIKNIHLAIELLFSLKGEIEFAIYGNIDGEEYWNKCKELIAKAPANVKIEYKGFVEHTALHKVFQDNHLFLSPTQSENYGHSIVEALIHSRPIVISTETPWTSINESGGGFAGSLDNISSFVDALQRFVDMDNEEYQAACKNAESYISERLNTEGLIKEYIKVLS